MVDRKNRDEMVMRRIVREECYKGQRAAIDRLKAQQLILGEIQIG